eukprot:4180271-Amphidinium_carterae.1
MVFKHVTNNDKHKNHTWEESKMRNFDDIAREAKSKGQRLYVGRVFGIAGIKGRVVEGLR